MFTFPKQQKTFARSQYEGTLKLMSLEAIREIAFREHSIRAKLSVPKVELIEKILDAKYGKEASA